MDEDALVVAELVRFDFMLLGFGVVRVALAGTIAPRSFHDLLLSEEVGGLDSIGFVGGAEVEAVAEIQRQHLRLATK